MAHERRFLALQPPQIFMETLYAYMLLARGPLLTVRFIGLAVFTVASVHKQHGLEEEQLVKP